jgi:hypothetical protein
MGSGREKLHRRGRPNSSKDPHRNVKLMLGTNFTVITKDGREYKNLILGRRIACSQAFRVLYFALALDAASKITAATLAG